jgi:hypothetical protein
MLVDPRWMSWVGGGGAGRWVGGRTTEDVRVQGGYVGGGARRAGRRPGKSGAWGGDGVVKGKGGGKETGGS